MRNNEQFYTDGCGIMIHGDDDVRLYSRGGYNDLADQDAQPCEAAEVHFMSGAEYNFAGVLKPGRQERYVDDNRPAIVTGVVQEGPSNRARLLTGQGSLDSEEDR